jgi:transcription termination factor Rho
MLGKCSKNRNQNKKNFPRVKINLEFNRTTNSLNLSELKKRNLPEIREWAKKNKIDIGNLLWKQDVIFTILKWNIKNKGIILGSGILEIFPDGYGFLRTSSYNYRP